MPHEQGSESLGLIGIDHDKSDFCRSRANNDIPATADDHRLTVFDEIRAEGDMIVEIDIEKKSHLTGRKTLLRREEAPPHRLRAGPPDGGQHSGRVVETQRANINRTAVAKTFDSRVVSEIW